MMMISWIRQRYDRFRKWREARAQEQARRFVESASKPENVDRLRRKNEEEYGRLVLDEDGFCLLKKGCREFAIRWADVRTIRTFKHDFFSHDMIGLAFELGEDEWIEIWESMVDFVPVTQRMQDVFPTVPEDWYEVVMDPAFRPNERALWRR